MKQAKRNPVPLGGDRVSGTNFVCAEIFPENNPPRGKIQRSDGPFFDPAAMPIIAKHWPLNPSDYKRAA